jgi:glycosyltransferase involved in cell wall biosynthesis
MKPCPVIRIEQSPILVSVIVPAFNEAKTLPGVLKALLAESEFGQIIVVNDGSTDDTKQALEPLTGSPRVSIVSHDGNRGKGAAIRTGLALVKGRYCAIQDADLEYCPRDLVRLLQPLIRGEASVVYGCRSRPETVPSERRWFARGVSVLNFMVRALYGVRISDEATCYKLFPSALIKSFDLRCQRFEFCPEVTAKICRLRISILEMPIDYTPRSIAEGKKIRFRDAIEAAWTLVYWRFARMPEASYIACAEMHKSRLVASANLSRSLQIASSHLPVESR